MRVDEHYMHELRELRATVDRLRGLLLAIATNKHHDLSDAIYSVREREGEGWDGPAVKAWGEAVDGIKAELGLK